MPAFDETSDFDTRYLFPRKTSAFLNLWYRSYEEARLALEQYPNRFLFPFRTQFVVCEASMLEHLGLDTGHPDWTAIGHDWYRPHDEEAKRRLVRLLKAQLETQEPLVPNRPQCA